MTTLLLLSASLRRESWNSRLLDHLAFSLQWQCAVDVLDPRAIGLPLFDQDLEADAGVRATLDALQQRLASCDGLLVCCPEYNGQATPLLKNTVDWLSRLPHLDSRYANPFLNKPVLLCSASTGRSGGALAIQNMRALFGYAGSVVVGHSVGIASVHKHWTPDGFGFDDATQAHLDASLSALLQWAGQHAPSSASEALAL